MNIEICKHCKLRTSIIYRKYFNNYFDSYKDIIEEVICLEENQAIMAVNKEDLICDYMYDINLNKWKLFHVKNESDKLSDNELDEKLKLNKKCSVFNSCPFKTEHELYDLINKK